MDKESFLGAVARAYADRYKDLSEFCFIFPNRRSATFFLKRLAEKCGDRVMLAPEALPMGDFMKKLSGMEVAPRITQLTLLYQAYRELQGSKKAIDDSDGETADRELLDFDAFLPWGEVVLADFSEVDMYDIEAGKLFQNVVAYRSIATDPLTDEQKDLIERYFGYRPKGSDIDGFWSTLEEHKESNLKNKFLELWKLLPQLYEVLREKLRTLEPGLPMCVAGTSYRIAMEKVRALGAEALPWKHVVTVGLDWLSTTEIKLLETLRDLRDEQGEPLADFFWDMTGPVLTDSEDASGGMIRFKCRQGAFPMPGWADGYMAAAGRDTMPQTVEIAVPSNAMQTKVAGQWIDSLLKEGLADDIQNARVAVVLPDENLLLPLLYSLPEDEENDADDPGEETRRSCAISVNLTMGWSVRYTSTAAFMYHLQRTLRRCRRSSDAVSYLAADLRTLVAQPIAQILIGAETVVKMNTYLDRSRRRMLSWEEINGYSPQFGDLLRPANDTRSLRQSVAWLDNLLRGIDSRLSETDRNRAGIKVRVERMLIKFYLAALHQISAAASRTDVEMRPDTLFHLLGRMVNGDKIRFEGEPLEGLQVMGLLETRALDFDRIIILSMNDKCMPRHARKRSFIPDSLRRGYGLPSSSNDERLYAYWFYRLMSRTRHATLVYDSRVGEGMRSGGKSRFLMQLEKLHLRNGMTLEKRNFELGAELRVVEEVAKSPEVMKRLEAFKSDDPEKARNLSATAINSYLKCPLQFYYRFVLQYNDDPGESRFIDAITQGNIFHNMMLRLYFPRKEHQRVFLREGNTFSRTQLASMLDDDAMLERAMRRAVNEEFLHAVDDKERDAPLSASTAMVSKRLLNQVKGILRHDMQRAPVTLHGGEVKFKERWRIAPGLTVNMTASFDRVDENDNGNLRIVDFKTGAVHLEMKSLDNVFNADYKAGNILQLLLYANMLSRMAAPEGGADVDMAIFDTNKMEHGGSESSIAISKSSFIHNQNDETVKEFIPMLFEKISEIFDPEIPFAPTDDTDTCTHCPMHRICGR